MKTAREVKTVKKGLVLEGGGMRAIFTAGVLDFFIEEGFVFDTCIGVSAGACHAASFLSRQKGRAYDTFTKYMNDKRYSSLESWIKTGNFFNKEFAYGEIPDKLLPFDHDTFEKSTTHFYATVTNCETGQAEYIRVTDFRKQIEAIRASSSLPLVSTMVPIDGKLYLDGGVADSVPIAQSMKLGNEKNVVVLTRPNGYRKKKNCVGLLIQMVYRKYPHFVKAYKTRHENYNETMEYLYQQQEMGNVYIIQPEEEIGIGRLEKNEEKMRVAYEYGYALAKRKKQELVAFLNGE